MFFSIVLLTIGFTCLIELLHSLRSNKDKLTLYWILINSKNIFVWLFAFVIMILGWFSCKKSFLYTKEKWNEVVEEIKIGFIK